MAISALPSTTIRLLNSAQVLTTPVSLVKELVDNALDAKATSVDILISQNTLDKIEVRDNGHGIQPEDLDALARHGHTSKLRSFEELKLIGGLTLGFRGEGLASAVELGEVTVITKTEGESVGTMVKLKPAGGIDHQARISHPVGTTISVKNFMAKLPVRKKVFEKEVTKTFAAITRLLQAYALARPSIRLNLKVSHGGKGSWSFIPHPSGDIREAISRAIGRDIAMQCVDTIVPSQYESQASGTAPPLDANPGSGLENFVIEAFLPNPHADPKKVMGGQYMSVDSRPVSHEKGTMKKIVTTFKKYIRNILYDMDEKIKSPFIRLNIRCPIASYDPNIEPAKDEVLFENEDRLLDIVDNLFKAVYGDCRNAATVSAPPLPANVLDNVRSTQCLDTRRQYLELESTPEMRSSKGPSVEDHAGSSKDNELAVGKYAAINGTYSNMPSKWGFDMSEDLTIEVEGNDQRLNIYQHTPSPHTRAIRQILPGQEHQPSPWSIAKKASAPASELPSASINTHCFPTQRADRNIPALGAARRRAPLPESSLLGHFCTPSRHTRSKSSAGLQLSINTKKDVSLMNSERALPLTRKNDFITADIVPETLISPPPTQSSKPSIIKILRPFSPPPLHTHAGTLTDGLRQTELVSVCRSSPTVIDDPQGTSTNSELIWAMDFEKRKEEATRRRREEIKASRSISTDPSTSKGSRSSPHKNRYNSATASLTEIQSSLHIISKEQNKMPYLTRLSHDDPLAYLMGRRRTMASEVSKTERSPKLKQAKSVKLPLEAFTRADELQNLIQLLPVEIDLLRQVAATLGRYDTHAGEFFGLPVEQPNIQIIMQKLQAVVTAKMKDVGCEEVDIEDVLNNAVLRSMN